MHNGSLLTSLSAALVLVCQGAEAGPAACWTSAAEDVQIKGRKIVFDDEDSCVLRGPLRPDGLAIRATCFAEDGTEDVLTTIFKFTPAGGGLRMDVEGRIVTLQVCGR